MSADPIMILSSATVPSRHDPDLPSLHGLTWAVNPHDFWVIGGPQGAGKSDLMFMLAALTRPLEGTYEVFGEDMTRRFGDEFLPNRLRMALVFDDARLFNALTVADNVSLPIRYHQNLPPEESAGWLSALLS